MNNIKLTIAIPTYNGASNICETLDSILIQMQTGVDIIISDNASTENTSEIIKEYQLKYPCIKYYCNEENLGMDSNFDLAVRRSEGEFVWLFSDDDIMMPGAIKKVMSILNEYQNLVAIYVNYSVYSIDLATCIQEYGIEIEKDRLCSNGNQFLDTVMQGPGFLSADVVNRAIWMDTDITPYMGTNWVQFGTILNMVENRLSYCIAKPYIKLRIGAIRWAGNGQFFLNMLNFIEILQNLKKSQYKPAVLNKTINIVMQSWSLTISSAKRDGLDVNIRLIKRMVEMFGGTLLLWLWYLPMLLVPNFIYRLVYGKYLKPIFKKLVGR